jgi:hypothetical protein
MAPALQHQNRRAAMQASKPPAQASDCALRLCCREDAHAPDCTTYDPARKQDDISVQASDEPMTWQKRYDLGASREAAMLAEISDWRERFAATTRATTYAEQLEMRERVARAIWNVQRDEEDRCDIEVEELGSKHPIWREADAAIAATKGAKP